MTFLKNTLITLMANMGTMLLSLITGVIIARTLGPTGKGMMTTVLLWPMMLIWGVGLSLGFANIYFGAGEPETRKRLFANSCLMALLIGIPASILACCLLPHFIILTHRQKLLLDISLILLPTGLLGDYSVTLLTGTNQFVKISKVRLASPLIITAGYVVLTVAHKMTLTSGIAFVWIGSLTQSCLLFRYLNQAQCIGFMPDLALLRRSLQYCLRIHFGTLASLANGRLDQLIMTAVVMPRALGLYAFAVTLSELIRQITGSLTTVLFPKTAAQADPNLRLLVIMQAARWTLLISATLAVCIYFIAPYFVMIFWGARFAGAIPTVRILLPGVIMVAVASVLRTGLNGAGLPIAGTIAEIASLVVMVPLLLILIPRIGIFGAGVASSIGYTVNCLVITLFFVRAYGRKCLTNMLPSVNDWYDLRNKAKLIITNYKQAEAVSS